MAWTRWATSHLDCMDRLTKHYSHLVDSITCAPTCHTEPALFMYSAASANKADHISHVQLELHCSLPQYNSLSMHINMPLHTQHYPSHCLNPPMHTTNTTSWQNGTRCGDGVKVLWCHSHLVWLVFEGSIPTWACFHSEIFFETWYR